MGGKRLSEWVVPLILMTRGDYPDETKVTLPWKNEKKWEKFENFFKLYHDMVQPTLSFAYENI